MANKLQHFFTWLFTAKYLKLDDGIKLRCSRCRHKMDELTKGGVTIDVCPNCNGMFLDDGEIEKLLKLETPTDKGKHKDGKKK